MAVVGVAAVVLGALLFLALYTSVDKRQSVLAVARPVAAGEVVGTADLRVVRVSSAAGITPVPASQAKSVVGETAAVALAPGTLLAPSQLGSSATLQAGQAVVGVAVKAGQAPLSLRAGTRVEVVETAKPANANDQARPVILSPSAIVSATGKADNSSSATTVVSLTLPAADAPAVAAAAAAGTVSLVVLPAS